MWLKIGTRPNPRPSPSCSLPAPKAPWWKGRDLYAAPTAVLLVGIAVFLFSTVRHGLSWDGDSALYIMHAQNIAEKLPYANTGYIFNPQRPIHPAAYPPGLPLLLAPVYSFAGLDLHKMKMVGVGAFLLLLVIFARIARQWLPAPIALALTALLGLHPFLWNFKDNIFSELPFMLFCYAALYFADRLDPRSALPRRWAIAAAAVALAFACLTRTIGVVLFPITFLLTIYRSKRIVNPGTPVIALAAAIVVLASVLFPSDVVTYAGYFKGFRGLATVEENAFANMSAIIDLVVQEATPGHWWLRDGWVVAFLLLVLLGWTVRVRARFSVYELFFVAYAVFFMVYPENTEPSRYLLPLWPLFLLYGFCGARVLGALRGSRAQWGAPALLFAVFCGLYAQQFARADFGPIPYSVTDPPARELFHAIKTEVPADASVLAQKPTIVALFTQRRAAAWPTDVSDDELWRYMGEIRARYIVENPLHLAGGPKPQQRLHAFIQRNRPALELVFSNSWFRLYRVSANRAI